MPGDALIAAFSTHDCEIPVRVTRAAGIAGHAAAVGTSYDGWKVWMVIVALPRTVAGRVTVHAARTHHHFEGFREQRSQRACGSVMPAKAVGGRSSSRFCASVWEAATNKSVPPNNTANEIATERLRGGFLKPTLANGSSFFIASSFQW